MAKPIRQRRRSTANRGSSDKVQPANRCARCGCRIEGRYWKIESRDGIVCDSCYSAEFTCQVCRAVIRGEYYTLASGGYAHADCYETLPRCTTCGARDLSVRALPDGRLQCGKCAEGAINSTDELEGLWQPALRYLQRTTATRLSREIPIELVDATEMKRISGQVPPGTPPGTSAPVGLFVRRGDDFRIYVEQGHPGDQVISVLIHEYAHALVAHRGLLLTEEENEGYACWLQYRYFMDHGRRADADRLLDDGSVYGRGLRLMLSREREIGVLRMLDPS